MALSYSYFLVIDGLVGDVAVPGFASNGFQVSSYSWALQVPVAATGGAGGATTGKPAFGEFVLTKNVGPGSTSIFYYAAIAKRFPQAVLVAFQTGTTREVERYTLKNAIFTLMHNSGAQGGQDTVELQLAYTAVTYQITFYDSTGNKTGTEQHSWDLTTNAGA